MVKSPWLPAAAALVCALAAVGCGSAARQDRPALAPPPAPSEPAAAAQSQPDDPVEALIARSQRHFDAGERELAQGHLEQARREFDRALEVLLEAPGGARTEPRLRTHFDRLVDRISAHEMAKLAQGDGFTETPAEPATIDELLALSMTFEMPAPDARLTELVRNDLAQTMPDVPITLNSKVLAYVDLFQGRLRGFLQEGMQRGSQYLPMIQSVFRSEGLPLDLAYIPLIESAFKPSALSRAKARGVWQFMRGTALENGLQHDWYVDERSDPEKATRAAAKYLKTLHGMFKDWHLALASYNGGPGRVQRAMRRSGRDDFWKLSATTRYLPRETREYVPMILAAIIIARNPGQYGFEVVPEDLQAPETVELPGGTDLRRVAEWTGTDVNDIQQLNPELRRWTTPLRAEAYPLKVPAGTADAVRAQLERVPAHEREALNWHTVRSGETLLSIARKLRVSRNDLAEANYLSTRSRVRVGQKLVIPRAPAVLMASQPDRPAPAAADATPAVQRAALVTRTDTQPVKVTYRVRRGDTLSAIARMFDTTVARLKQWNRLQSSRINIGDRLTVFTHRTLD